MKKFKTILQKGLQNIFQPLSKELENIRKSQQNIQVWVTLDRSAGQIDTTFFKMNKTESVYEIKLRIQAKWQIPVQKQRLTLLGRFKTLNDGDIIHELQQACTHLNAFHVECVLR